MDLLTDIVRGLIGIVSMIAICYAFSANRKAINWKLVLSGIALQIILALLILKVDFIYDGFKIVSDGFVALLGFADAGAAFLFGAWPESGVWLVNEVNGAAPPGTVVPVAPDTKMQLFKLGYMFAFKVLPTIIFFAAFTSILYYLGILQKIIYVFAKGMSKVMSLSGAESLAAAANVFIGQTEAPLVIKPYLDKMTKSEIMCLMTGGMATIAGGIFALCVSLLGPQYALHFLTASIISAPAAIVTAKILYPETMEVDRSVAVPKEKLGNNLLDAISIGTTDGVKLAVNVGAMLLVFISLVAMINAILGWFGGFTGLNGIVNNFTDGRFATFNLESILGLIFAPIAWLLGTPSEDLILVGSLLGKKTAVNEVVGYVDLSIMIADAKIQLSDKSIVIATYALCGFSNFSSIGIQIGGISAISPKQRPTLTELGLKALIGGTIACFLTAAVAGMMLDEIIL